MKRKQKTDYGFIIIPLLAGLLVIGIVLSAFLLISYELENNSQQTCQTQHVCLKESPFVEDYYYWDEQCLKQMAELNNVRLR